MNSRAKGDKKTFAPPPADKEHELQFDTATEINAISVGNSVFQLEQVIRKRRIRKLVIPLYRPSGAAFDLARLSSLLHDLIVFTLIEDVEIDFRELRRAEQQSLWRPTRTENVCLFSGGVDSYAGLLLSRNALGSVEGAFCAHADQARIIHIVAALERKFIGPTGTTVTKIPVPSMGAHGYAQLRGFLYLLSAGALVHKLDANNIIVTEVGPTMYQPQFSPLDSITMTTHPFVVKTAKDVLSLLLGRKVRVTTPFEDLTKAEVVAICPAKRGLKYTHSCITQRFGTHDGTCYGCVIRRLATTAAGVADVKYNSNPIADPHANSGNLYSLLGFCSDILVRYREMEEFQTGPIQAYGKRNLFKRFALDNFSAILRLIQENKRVVKPVREMYDMVVQTIDELALEARLALLESAEFEPTWD
jgi:7-cyano-7-deazaguanine synthase in queuosine biosynthesis